MNKEKKGLLILGASSDVGSELIASVDEQYDLILAHFCHSNEKIEKLKKRLGARMLLLQADLSQREELNQMITTIKEQEITDLHIVHMAAPKCRNVKFIKSSLADFEREIQVSVYSILEELLPEMAKNKTGKVIFMLTAYTKNIPPKYLSPYITAKYALLGLMKSLSAEYAERGIAVNAVSPEMMETKFLSDIPELVVEQNAAANPMGRNLTVDEVIPAFAFLLSKAADCITGENITVTGVKHKGLN